MKPTESKHSPLPLNLPLKIDGEYLADSQGASVVRILGSAPYNRSWQKQIVRAVNSHDALVEALEDCIQSLSRMPETDGAYKTTCIQQARAALKLAKGE